MLSRLNRRLSWYRGLVVRSRIWYGITVLELIYGRALTRVWVSKQPMNGLNSQVSGLLRGKNLEYG